MYDITVGTNHQKYAEPPDTVIKCTNFNRRPIQNCTSVYQMKIYSVRSALIISKNPFAFIKGYISSDPVDYLLCNQCKDNDKANWP